MICAARRAPVLVVVVLALGAAACTFGRRQRGSAVRGGELPPDLDEPVRYAGGPGKTRGADQPRRDGRVEFGRHGVRLRLFPTAPGSSPVGAAALSFELTRDARASLDALRYPHGQGALTTPDLHGQGQPAKLVAPDPADIS